MLEELKKFNISFGKRELLYFLQEVLGTRVVSRKDVLTMFRHASNGLRFHADEIISYCKNFSWVDGTSRLKVTPLLIKNINDADAINNEMIEMTVYQMFQEKVFSESSFSFSPEHGLYRLKHETIPLCYSGIRDVLTSQGFLILQRNNNSTTFYVDEKYQRIVAKYTKAYKVKMRLDELKKRLEADEEAGNMAEEYVMQFEKNRLPHNLASKILRVSEIDVGAGYDIASFENCDSYKHDCFIEVKAISSRGEFFWSKNEFETAKLFGNRYKLYLINLSQISNLDYKPQIIVNPAQEIFPSECWSIETQLIRVRKVI